MANPRQRRKARSSTHRPVSHSRRAKTLKVKKMPAIRGPRALQDAWDKHKTVRQNYAALGLVHKLNPTLSGGVEINTDGQPEVPTTPETSQQKQIPKGFGRIVRDGDGNVVRIELAEPEEEQAEEQGGLPEPAIDSVAIDKWVSQLGGAPQENKASNVVKGITSILAKKSDADDSAGADLESIAAPCTSKSTLSVPLSGVGSRHSSKGELAYLENLRAKYGTDVEAMSRDRKLNYMQRTVGELRKAFKRADSLL